MIEKEIHQGKIQYRIYQAWILQFTLLNWLEERGKTPFTSSELKKFIANVTDKIQNPRGMLGFFCCAKKIKKGTNIRVIKFDFNTNGLERSYAYVTKTPRKSCN